MDIEPLETLNGAKTISPTFKKLIVIYLSYPTAVSFILQHNQHNDFEV